MNMNAQKSKTKLPNKYFVDKPRLEGTNQNPYAQISCSFFQPAGLCELYLNDRPFTPSTNPTMLVNPWNTKCKKVR